MNVVKAIPRGGMDEVEAIQRRVERMNIMNTMNGW